MNDELSPAENVNTKRLAAMQKLRRMHEAGQVDRRHSIYAIASGVVMLLFMVLTVLGTRFEWRAQTMWEVGMWLGVSTAMFIGMLAMRFIWPFYASIIDWDRAAPLPADAGEDKTDLLSDQFVDALPAAGCRFIILATRAFFGTLWITTVLETGRDSHKFVRLMARRTRARNSSLCSI